MDKRATVPAPQHDYLVCIDSDGCAFDTMEIKHKECFCPAFIKVFGLQPISKYVREAWEYGNLYSVHRGRSRFIEILLVFDWRWLVILCQAVILATTLYSGVEYFLKNKAVFKS